MAVSSDVRALQGVYGTNMTAGRTRWRNETGVTRGWRSARLRLRGAGLGPALEPRLGLGDVDLDAVGALGGRAVAEGGGALGRQEPLARFLPLPVHRVQGALLHRHTPAPRGLLWYRRRDLLLLLPAEERRLVWGRGPGRLPTSLPLGPEEFTAHTSNT